MKTQIKRTAILATAISLILASSFAMAAGNAITFEEDSLNNGTGNYANIDAQTTTGTKAVSIYQVGSGSGANAGEKNQVGDSNKLTLSGNGDATVHIGQGANWNGAAWAKTAAAKGNLVSGTIATGTVIVNQNSSGHTVAISANSGNVTVNQGKADGTAGGAFSSDVTQNGSGAVTITQGSSGTAGTTGSVTVVHAGTHTVAITQDKTSAGVAGAVITKTTGDGGSLTITNSNTGVTYVNAEGTSSNTTAATVTGTAVIENSGTGVVALKDATGSVTAKASGAGTLTMTQSGAGNTFVDSVGDGSGSAVSIDNVATLVNSGIGTMKLTKADGNVYANISGGTLAISNTGATNTVYVNAAGDSGNAAAGMTGGTLTLNSNGASNEIKVQSFAGGTMTVGQDSAANNSSFILTGSNIAASTATVNQYGDYQNATVHSVNGSTGTFDLREDGVSGTPTTVDLTL